MAGNATININAVDNTRRAFLDVQRSIDKTKQQAAAIGSSVGSSLGKMALSVVGPMAAFQTMRGLIRSVITDIENIPGVSEDVVQSITAMNNSFTNTGNTIKRITAETLAFFDRLSTNIALVTVLGFDSPEEEAERKAMSDIRNEDNRRALHATAQYKAQSEQLIEQAKKERQVFLLVGATKQELLQEELRIQQEIHRTRSTLRPDDLEFLRGELEMIKSFTRAEKLRLEIEKEVGKEVKLADPIAEQMTAFEQSVFNTFDRVGDRASQLFADMVLTGKASFGQLASIVARSMLEIVARMAVINPLLNMVFGLTGPAALPSFFGGARAGGGQVSTGKSYLVGERGPEMFSPSSAGHITQNSKLGSGASQTFFIDARGADQTGLARLEGMIRETRASIRPIALASVMDTRARGGAMGRAA